MAFGCCHVVAAGIAFLESCSMSLMKTSGLGKASGSHGVSWESHLAFLLGFYSSIVMGDEAPNWEMRSDGPKRLRGKKKGWSKVDYFLLKPGMCVLNPWNSLSGVRKGRKLKIGCSFPQSRTSLYLGGFNTIYCLFNHPVATHRDGHHGMSAVGTGWHEHIWSQALSLLLSRKAALMVLSKQPYVHPNRHDSDLCSGSRTVPAAHLGWVAWLWRWVGMGTVRLDQDHLQVAVVTCLHPHMASKE